MDRLLRNCVIAAAALLCVATQVVCRLCNGPCLCPHPSPRCPDGVPLLADSCRCCQVCARQWGESCSEMLPCDSQRGLRCDHSASLPGEPGECVRDEDLGCEVDGVTYREGQWFQPSCDTRCRCTAGGVTCVPACPLSVRLPSPDCPSPQYIKLPGRCCGEWVCEPLENTVIQDAIAATRPNGLWAAVPGNRPLHNVAPQAPSCVERSTRWSGCSQSCGAGVSTRVSNRNPACKLQMETRLCKVRPCRSLRPAPEELKQGRCWASYVSPRATRLLHHGCYSTRAYRPRYCGQCTDARCCTPHQTATVQVSFRCPAGRLVRRAVMMIQSCVCHGDCPYSPSSNPALWGFRP